ncbi:hypothetical protein MIMGU_mgv11b013789mg [Erythranthe guttata]|uniref:Uncharacterized protein n=2 Tax=Erythranthe guttata TaxID=4155 RepID=A0A022S1W9_ERYGU|nr:hypothetical protein MIMGU_mgv11b013789mg [Erythranthe guttata]
MDKLIQVKVEDCLESHSSHVPSDVKGRKTEYAEECSRSSPDELRGKASEPEDVKVFVAADEKCTVSGYETTASDGVGQKPIESATLSRSNENEEPENSPEIGSCEDQLLPLPSHHLPDCF